MGMVTEMHLPGGGGEPGTRFNYRGMHRYLITLLGHPSCGTIADRETVIPTLDVLREWLPRLNVPDQQKLLAIVDHSKRSAVIDGVGSAEGLAQFGSGVYGHRVKPGMQGGWWPGPPVRCEWGVGLFVGAGMGFS